MSAKSVEERLEELRAELRAERISYGELAELESLAEHIRPDDVELREAAGMPEHGAELDGILWPWMPSGDASLPWVERDDESEVYATDDDAARALSELTGTPVMWAALDGAPQDREHLRPFVLPALDCGSDWARLARDVPAIREASARRELLGDDEYVSAFCDGYVECALWSSVDFDESGGIGSPLDDDYVARDLDASAAYELVTDCVDFIEGTAMDLTRVPSATSIAATAARCGHDFWLTRNRHGAGFWDRGYGDLGEQLSSAAKVYGSQDLYVGDDARIYVTSHDRRNARKGMDDVRDN